MTSLYPCASRCHSANHLTGFSKNVRCWCKSWFGQSPLASCQRTLSSCTFLRNLKTTDSHNVQKTNRCQSRRLFSGNVHKTTVPVCYHAMKVSSPKPHMLLHHRGPLQLQPLITSLKTWRGISTSCSKNVPRGTLIADVMREEKERKESFSEVEEGRNDPDAMKKSMEEVSDAVAGVRDEDEVVGNIGEEDRPHTPVLLTEVLKFLKPKENQIFLDLTFGAGSHTEAILQQCESCQVLALDRDPLAYELANNMAQKYGKDRLVPLLGRFSNLTSLLTQHQISSGSVDGVLIDAGCSSMQFDTAERGFALSKDGPLDMRMDGNRLSNQPTAADYINSLDAQTLASILIKYGEEKRAKKIAQTIVGYRENYRPIQTTQELATVVSFAFTHREANRTKDSLGRRSHVATKTFLALRILVNNELHELHEGLKQVESFVKPGGKLAVIAFHSMEDRIVKRFLQGRDVTEKRKSIHKKKFEASVGGEDSGGVAKEMIWDIQKDLVTACDEEIKMNPRARSAKLRTAVKLL